MAGIKLNKYQKITISVIAIVIGALLITEFVMLGLKHNEALISPLTLKWALIWPPAPFLYGLLGGHFLIPSKLVIPIPGWATSLILSITCLLTWLLVLAHWYNPVIPFVLGIIMGAVFWAQRRES